MSQFSLREKNIVDQILEQGQRLRNSMVKSILNNDPFCSDFSGKSSYGSKNKAAYEKLSNRSNKQKLINEYELEKQNNEFKQKSELVKKPTNEEKQTLIAYIRGDKLEESEERKALETFRNMSNSDLLELTERSTCTCSTCKAYYGHKFSSSNLEETPFSLKHSLKDSKSFSSKNHKLYPQQTDVPPLSLESTKRSLETKIQNKEYFKYIDCIRITVLRLSLNQEGLKKLYSKTFDEKMKLPPSYSHTYFIEYSIPECLIRSEMKKSKVDSGLHSSNKIRICSKKVNKFIYFNHTSTHDIKQFHEFNLKTVEVIFRISCRTQKQKNSNFLGIAKFNFADFEKSEDLNCIEDLAIFLSEEKPIILGYLRVEFNLGYERLYFGREFVGKIFIVFLFLK